MQQVLAAGVAVVGTLLGSVIAYLFQRSQAFYVSSLASRLQMRDEHISAYASFVEGIADLRGAQVQRWMSRHEDPPDSEEYMRTRTESWRLRKVARSAMYRVQLVVDDENVATQARQLVEMTLSILEAQDSDEMSARAENSATATELFIVGARLRLQDSLEAQGLKTRLNLNPK